MADVAARGGKGFGKVGWLDGTRRFKKDCREDQALHESKAVGSECLGCYTIKVPCRPLHREHGTLVQKGFNAHMSLVYPLNYLGKNKSIVASFSEFLHDRFT